MADDDEPQDALEAEPETDAETEPEEFLNRAARRAKGKNASAASQPGSKGNKVGNRGPVTGQRQWANRRSG